MQESFRRVTRLLAAATAAGALSLAGATASADSEYRVAELRPKVHVPHGGMGVGSAEMDRMHAEMSARLPVEDRALHDRMHMACTGPTTGGEGP